VFELQKNHNYPAGGLKSAWLGTLWLLASFPWLDHGSIPTRWEQSDLYIYIYNIKIQTNLTHVSIFEPVKNQINKLKQHKLPDLSHLIQPKVGM
jgi:hypothetical protein